MKCHEKFPKTIKVGSAVVKVYRGKAHGYDLFTVAYHENGKRQRRTFGKLADAKAAAQAIALKIAQGRSNSVELTGAHRDSYMAALNLLRPHGLPLLSVLEEYLAAREHLGDSESLLSAVKDNVRRHRHVIEKRVTEVVEEFLATKKRDGASQRYLKSLRSDLRRFAAAFQINIAAVTSG